MAESSLAMRVLLQGQRADGAWLSGCEEGEPERGSGVSNEDPKPLRELQKRVLSSEGC